MHRHIYVCFPAYFLRAFVGPSGENESWFNMEQRDEMSITYRTKYPIDIPSPLCRCLLRPKRGMILELDQVAVTSQANRTVRLEANGDHLSGWDSVRLFDRTKQGLV